MHNLAAGYKRSFGERLAQARRLKSLREWRDVTQGDIAKEIGTTSATVSRWESNEIRPRGPTLRTIAQALGVSLRWLETGRDRIASPLESAIRALVRELEFDFSDLVQNLDLTEQHFLDDLEEIEAKKDIEDQLLKEIAVALSIPPARVIERWMAEDFHRPNLSIVDGGNDPMAEVKAASDAMAASAEGAAPKKRK